MFVDLREFLLQLGRLKPSVCIVLHFNGVSARLPRSLSFSHNCSCFGFGKEVKLYWCKLRCKCSMAIARRIKRTPWPSSCLFMAAEM